MVKKILIWGSIAFLLFFVAYNPEGAAQVAKNIGAGLANLADGFQGFWKGLMG